MRVALITDGIWPYVLGGMQKHSYYLCKYLAKNKVEVDLYHFNQSTYDISKLEFFSEEEKQFIRSYIVPFPTSLPFPGHYLYKSYKHSKLIFQAMGDKLASYDFIYTKGFTGWELISKKYSGKIRCAPIGVKFHGYEMFQTPPDLKTKLQHVFLLRRPVAALSRKADYVFSYGGKITDIIRSLGIPDRKILEIPSGVEAAIVAENIKNSGPVLKFLFLGRYERRKGIEELNQAILQLMEKRKFPAEFHFVGPIPEERRLQKDGIVYHGEIRDKQQLNTLIRTCDILVCPSWSEGMPNVILEAMANGLAVMATDVGATNVLVSDTTGWLLKDSDPKTIQACFEEILGSDTKEIDARKTRSLQLIKEQFTWEKLIGRLQSLLFK